MNVQGRSGRHAQIFFSLDRDPKSAIVHLARINLLSLPIGRVPISPALRVPLDSGMLRSRLGDTPIIWSLEAKSTQFPYFVAKRG